MTSVQTASSPLTVYASEGLLPLVFLVSFGRGFRNTLILWSTALVVTNAGNMWHWFARKARRKQAAVTLMMLLCEADIPHTELIPWGGGLMISDPQRAERPSAYCVSNVPMLHWYIQIPLICLNGNITLFDICIFVFNDICCIVGGAQARIISLPFLRCSLCEYDN